MIIRLTEENKAPIYQQVADYFVDAIQSGALLPGVKLPTVRELARENRLAQGTVKHAYDILEHAGCIEKRQGRGTFVSVIGVESNNSKKEQAMEAIDELLQKMEELSFSLRDTRIFFDLKMRERESQIRHVQVSAVDCSPEALSTMYQQIGALPHVDVYEYLLPTVLDGPALFHSNADIIVTTPTHADDLLEKLPPGAELLRLVMGISRTTIMELARIPPNRQVGILCASKRFADIIVRTCEEYGVLTNPPHIAYFGNKGELQQVVEQSDSLILPSNYLKFASQTEREMISQATGKQPPVIFRYQIDRGSLLHLEEQIEKIYRVYKTRP